MTKRCGRCKKRKSRSLFGKNRREPDGFQCYCKSCTARLAGAYRKSDKGKEIIRAYSRKWLLENAEAIRAYKRNWRLKNPEKLNAYRRNNPVKCKARDKIKGLIHRGKLIRGNCEVCGKKNAEAHHDDYSKPLSVRWLCRKHHVEFHVNYQEKK